MMATPWDPTTSCFDSTAVAWNGWEETQMEVAPQLLHSTRNTQNLELQSKSARRQNTNRYTHPYDV